MLTAGPALAGLIAAAPHLGLQACYLTDAVSFLAVLYGVARLCRRRGRRADRQPGGWRPGIADIAGDQRAQRRDCPIAGAIMIGWRCRPSPGTATSRAISPGKACLRPSPPGHETLAADGHRACGQRNSP
ncbi:MAG TPA: hypothetical protein DHU96_28845 [Actinobacteria bacterium]|nr:hypothetical protein [Actinomycetota bacterium]